MVLPILNKIQRKQPLKEHGRLFELCEAEADGGLGKCFGGSEETLCAAGVNWKRLI